ncbi:tripartite tricarboxylate transporter TctB family protein [soil metagenome]|nr:tripartite tricarboxylate transporter TctB family protein [Trueperaceae bacterium]
MTDRLSGLVLLAFSLWFGVLAWNLPRSFFSDPTGSRAFPLALAVLLTLLALHLLLRPSHTLVVWPDRAAWPALGITIVTLIAYALLLEPLGFVVATVIVFTALALVFRAALPKAAVAAVGATVALYLLFGIVLELYLPTGEAFEGWFR